MISHNALNLITNSVNTGSGAPKSANIALNTGVASATPMHGSENRTGMEHKHNATVRSNFSTLARISSDLSVVYVEVSLVR